MKNIKIEDFSEYIQYTYSCEQCGRCSSACPITGEDSFNIRQIIKNVEFSQTRELIKNRKVCLCIVCKRCIEACPNGVDILGLIRSIRSEISNKLIPKVPCIEACPAKINIPGFIRMIAKGEELKALTLILEKVPIPGILGRVCHRPCESKCRRSKIDLPVSICNLKRYVSDLKDIDGILEIAYKAGENTGKKILVIGSGPAGLAASYYLRKQGHFVTIIEERQKIGGMLRYGIPEYRLPKHILDSEIGRIIDMEGIKIKTNTRIVDFLDCKTNKNSFDAFFIATGLQSSRSLMVNSKFVNKIIYGLEFLETVNSNPSKYVGKKFLVLGGGNLALDAARSAMRLKVNSVNLVCLESKNKMLANPIEIEMALDEGVKIINSWGVNRFLGTNELDSIELINCTSIFDKSGTFNPTFGKQVMSLNVDYVIVAFGQVCNKNSVQELLTILGSKAKLKNSLIIDSNNKIVRNSYSNNIFAGGDIVGNGGSVVNAVASGYKVAMSIDHFLGGSGILYPSEVNTSDKSSYLSCHKNNTAETSYIKRQKTTLISKIDRIKNFSEVDCGLNEEQIIRESLRCLGCDLEYNLACYS